MTETAYSARCEANTRSGVGCKNAALPGSPWCHGHDPDRAMERARIASAGGRARSRPDTENAFCVGEAEQAARDAAVARENVRSAALDTLIDTRARDTENDRPPTDLQRSRDATRSARTRLLWAQWHAQQADRHRRTLTDLVAHHEAEAERLMR